jgi:hypothetical protein
MSISLTLWRSDGTSGGVVRKHTRKQATTSRMGGCGGPLVGRRPAKELDATTDCSRSPSQSSSAGSRGELLLALGGVLSVGLDIFRSLRPAPAGEPGGLVVVLSFASTQQESRGWFGGVPAPARTPRHRRWCRPAFRGRGPWPGAWSSEISSTTANEMTFSPRVRPYPGSARSDTVRPRWAPGRSPGHVPGPQVPQVSVTGRPAPPGVGGCR